jgi:hypothetical protein
MGYTAPKEVNIKTTGLLIELSDLTAADLAELKNVVSSTDSYTVIDNE